jgi:hypothetical protein
MYHKCEECQACSIYYLHMRMRVSKFPAPFTLLTRVSRSYDGLADMSVWLFRQESTSREDNTQHIDERAARREEARAMLYPPHGKTTKANHRIGRDKATRSSCMNFWMTCSQLKNRFRVSFSTYAGLFEINHPCHIDLILGISNAPYDQKQEASAPSSQPWQHPHRAC